MTDHIDQLRADVQDLTRRNGILDRLEAMLDASARHTGPDGGHRKVSGSPAPWNSEAANPLTDTAAWARQTEQDLRYALSGFLRPDRGGSNGNTGEALRAILRLAEAADEPTQRRIRRELSTLTQRALEALGEADRWVPLPVLPKCLPPSCPYCGTYTLRMARQRGLVRCISPGCVDGEGNTPVAVMQIGEFSGESSLVWRDGSAMIFTMDDEPEGIAS